MAATHTEEATAAADTPPADGSRWFQGCWNAVMAFVALFAPRAHAVTEFEKSLSGSGQTEHPAPGETDHLQPALR
ncbi:hypothetical protein [Streptomyces sp. YIM 132580]|uniref:hypothetical protein n=1 Tax=Streptomyces sp. YIM 132580 TaxID=2691958 RepID=UPI001925414B|nr:hypothetical protein [Streptomyces sp. YIM 132580]